MSLLLALASFLSLNIDGGNGEVGLSLKLLEVFLPALTRGRYKTARRPWTSCGEMFPRHPETAKDRGMERYT